MRRRPRASLIGPAISWPTASPAMNVVTVSWVSEDEVRRLVCTSGSEEM